MKTLKLALILITATSLAACGHNDKKYDIEEMEVESADLGKDTVTDPAELVQPAATAVDEDSKSIESAE